MIDKYSNLAAELPQLQKVLLDAIQSEFLEIKKVDKECMKFKKASFEFAALEKAEYVVFSKFIRKNEHKYETFVFLDKEGESVAHISGKDLELHGALESCTNLSFSDEYIEQANG